MEADSACSKLSCNLLLDFLKESENVDFLFVFFLKLHDVCDYHCVTISLGDEGCPSLE